MTVSRHALVAAFLVVVAGSRADAQQAVANEFFESKIRSVWNVVKDILV